MALKHIEKMKILEILHHSIDDIYYSDFFNLSYHSNYSISELLEYLVSLGNHELQKQDFSNKNFAKICYSLFLVLNYGNNDTVFDARLMEKIHAFNTCYHHFLKEHSMDSDLLVEQSLTKLDKALETYQPTTSHQETEDNSNESIDIDQKLEDYKNVFELLRQDNTSLQKQLQESKEKISELETNLKSIQKSSSQFETKYEDSHKEKLNLQNNLRKSQEQIIHLQNDLKEANQRAFQFELQYNSFDNEKKDQQRLEEKTKIIQEIILEVFYSQSASLEELKQQLALQQIFLSEDEIYQHIQSLKKKFAIHGPIFLHFPLFIRFLRKQMLDLYFPWQFLKIKKN